MGLGQLKDALVRERRRRLLGEDMAAAVRRPSRALAATATSDEETRTLLETLMKGNAHLAATPACQEPRGLETLMTGGHTNAYLAATAAPEEPRGSETLMTGRQTNARLSTTATVEEPRGLETLMMGRRATKALHSSPTVAGKFRMEAPCKLGNMLDESPIHHSDPVEVEGLLCPNAPAEIRPHAQLTGAAALIHGSRAATTISEEVVRLQQVKQQQSGRRLCPGPPEQEDASSFLLQAEGPLCSGVVSESRRPCQTHHRAATGPSEEAGRLETLIPGQHTALVFSSSEGAGNFSMVDSQDSDSDGNDNMMMMPIFVRHGSGKLTFTVRMDKSTNDLMQLYAQRTSTSLDSQYFVYQRKTLDPHHTWLSYGLKRDTTVHVCTRLLGGANDPNLQDYINNNKHKFVQVISLPGGGASLQMTMLGCQFLSSWIRCFTAAFSAGKSWNGQFKLVDFIFVDGHVRPTKTNKPKRHTNDPTSVGNDITKFAQEVEIILKFNGQHPPYLKACMKILRDLVSSGVTGHLASVTGPLPNEYKLLLDTLVCCMTSKARERLIIELFRKYEGADQNEKSIWDSAINKATCSITWRTDLSKSAMFKDFFQKANNAGKPYPKDQTGAFILLKDVVLHAADRSEDANAPQLGDGIELMIPANKHLYGFLPSIIQNLIEKNIDLSAELSAAIWCACNICDASH